MKMGDIVELYIQPIFCADKHKIKYAEALIRPLRSNISVPQILRLIDENGLDIQLDEFVLDRTCKFIRETNTKFTINVNMSKKAIESPGYCDRLLRILRINKVRIQKIIFEIHETTDYDNPIAKANIDKLIANGANIAMDDFGACNANLRNLHKFNIKMVKFNRSFLFNINKNTVESTYKLVSVLHKLGMYTVIEGVETKEQLAYANMVGYGYIQGFLLGKPVRMQSYREVRN